MNNEESQVEKISDTKKIDPEQYIRERIKHFTDIPENKREISDFNALNFWKNRLLQYGKFESEKK